MATYCPHCAALSNLTNGDIRAGGRLALCRQCGTTWFARSADGGFLGGQGQSGPIARAEEITDALIIEHEAEASERPGPQQRQWPAIGQNRLKLVAAALAVVVVFAVLRMPLALPGSTPTEELPIDVAAFVFEKVRSETVDLRGVRTLFVEGEIINRSDRDAALPAVRVSLRSLDGAEVSSWLVEPAVARLAAGRSIGFRSALASPPPAATEVKLDLAARNGQAVGLR